MGLKANFVKNVVFYYSNSKEKNQQIKDLEELKQLKELTPEEAERLNTLKEEKEFLELTKVSKEQNIKYYAVVENYKETNDQHIHVFIEYPSLVSYKTKERVKKLFGIPNLYQDICIPHINTNQLLINR